MNGPSSKDSHAHAATVATVEGVASTAGPFGALAPGQLVGGGRYRLGPEMDRGGFGAVFRATQVPLGREVALKILLPTARDPMKALLRFRREAELVQRLEHPNTVRVLDFGQLDTNFWFIAFELLRGKSLDKVIRDDGPFSDARTVRVATQALKSLMEAHARGVVHRDLKPQNLFLSDFDGEPDFVKVLDFGVAKASDANTGDDAQGLTRDGQMIGTPAYMSPEQVNGEAVGPETDLYALGLVLAECLAGASVVANGTPIQMCMIHASPKPLILPPAADASSLGPVLRKATAKDRHARYGSARDMLADIDALVRTGSSANVAAAREDSSPSTARIPQTAPRTASLTPQRTEITSAPRMNSSAPAMTQPSVPPATPSGIALPSTHVRRLPLYFSLVALTGVVGIVSVMGWMFYRATHPAALTAVTTQSSEGHLHAQEIGAEKRERLGNALQREHFTISLNDTVLPPQTPMWLGTLIFQRAPHCSGYVSVGVALNGNALRSMQSGLSKDAIILDEKEAYVAVVAADRDCRAEVFAIVKTAELGQH